MPWLSIHNRRKYRRMVRVVQDEKSGVCPKACPLNLHGTAWTGKEVWLRGGGLDGQKEGVEVLFVYPLSYVLYHIIPVHASSNSDRIHHTFNFHFHNRYVVVSNATSNFISTRYSRLRPVSEIQCLENSNETASSFSDKASASFIDRKSDDDLRLLCSI